MKTVKVTAEIPAPPEGYGEPEWGMPQKGCVWYGSDARNWKETHYDFQNNEVWFARPKPKVERWVVLWRGMDGEDRSTAFTDKEVAQNAGRHLAHCEAILGITHVVEGRFDLPLQEDEA